MSPQKYRTLRYIITPLPLHLGGGWRLQFFVNDKEAGSIMFPPQDAKQNAGLDTMQAAFSNALTEALAWQNPQTTER